MDYIFFFLEFILIAIGSVSLYTYLEIKEQQENSENAKQIALVTTIISFVVFASLLYLFLDSVFEIDRLVNICLITTIICVFTTFGTFYLLKKETDDSITDNQTIKNVNELTYFYSIFLVIWILGFLMGFSSSTEVIITKEVTVPEKVIIPKKVTAPKVTAPVRDQKDDLMDDFIGKDPAIQKVIIL